MRKDGLWSCVDIICKRCCAGAEDDIMWYSVCTRDVGLK